ncbi:DUF3489 domain-containing protein [Parasphingorhabdus sp. JC815]|uniref:DUF3489 domain-containing protein n=1 Tax=Parasphingorhabdus sp. JC815 TaxID=3232140 RepID=UPI00345B2376
MAISKTTTKSSKVIALLSRGRGASIDEIGKATNWKPHSIRAFLTGLRKKGFVLAREHQGEEDTVYRITSDPIVKKAS